MADGKFNPHLTGGIGISIILRKAFAHFAGNHANNWVDVVVVSRLAIKRIDRYLAFFELVSLSMNRCFDNMGQQLRASGGGSEPRTLEQTSELVRDLPSFCLGEL
jgi:hypothetical protein